MNRVDTLLAEYGSFHRARGNLICHAFGIPLIVYGILAMLREIPLPLRGWTAAEVAVAADDRQGTARRWVQTPGADIGDAVVVWHAVGPNPEAAVPVLPSDPVPEIGDPATIATDSPA